MALGILALASPVALGAGQRNGTASATVAVPENALIRSWSADQQSAAAALRDLSSAFPASHPDVTALCDSISWKNAAASPESGTLNQELRKRRAAGAVVWWPSSLRTRIPIWQLHVGAVRPLFMQRSVQVLYCIWLP